MKRNIRGKKNIFIHTKIKNIKNMVSIANRALCDHSYLASFQKQQG